MSQYWIKGIVASCTLLAGSFMAVNNTAMSGPRPTETAQIESRHPIIHALGALGAVHLPSPPIEAPM